MSPTRPRHAVPTHLRPTRTSLVWRALLGLAGLAMLYFGVADVTALNAIGIVFVALGALAVMEVARTPARLSLERGELRLRGLRSRSCGVQEIESVALVNRGLFRVPSYRFLRRDGTAAFETDATLWDRASLEAMLAGARLKVVRR